MDNLPTDQAIKERYEELDILKSLLVSGDLDPDDAWNRLIEMNISDRQFRQFAGVPYGNIQRLVDYLNSHFCVLDVTDVETFRKHGWLPNEDVDMVPPAVAGALGDLGGAGIQPPQLAAMDRRGAVVSLRDGEQYRLFDWDDLAAVLRWVADELEATVG